MWGDAADNEVEGLISDDGKTSSTTDGGDGSDRIPDDAFQVELNPDGDDVEFYVRSKVASYWRGLTLDVFDGRYWRAGITRSRQFQSPDGSRIWYNRDSVGLDNRIQYNHTFLYSRTSRPTPCLWDTGVCASLAKMAVWRAMDYREEIPTGCVPPTQSLTRSDCGWTTLEG